MCDDAKRLPPCGNPKCRVSTSIAETVTAGEGGPDRNGFFEKPCEVCERFFTALLREANVIDETGVIR